MGQGNAHRIGNLLEITNLCFKYGRKEVLHNISMDIREGEVVSIIGPSGSGKSTLLRAISMLSSPTSGQITFRGKKIFSSNGSVMMDDVEMYKRSIGVVFQELYLWPHLTVGENVMLPLVYGKNISDREARRKVEEILARLSILQLDKEYPPRLSVGQQQRCAIARTLAMEPSILLLDEITSALDPELVESIQTLIKEIAEDFGQTLLVVTHEMKFASNISNRLAIMNSGNILAFGTLEDIMKSSSQLTKLVWSG